MEGSRHSAHPTRRHDRASHRPRRGSNVGVVVCIVVLALVFGAVVGYLLRPIVHLPGSKPPASVAGAVTVTEDELDAVLGSYTAGGTTREVSVRDAILAERSLDAARTEAGEYVVPSADAVLAVARNELLSQDAANRGIQATPDDVAAYALEVVGTSDLAEAASVLGMDEAQATSSLTQAATLRLLRDSVVTTPMPAVPEPPAAPAAGAEDVMLPEYGAYVTALAGSEWDSAANMWAGEGGPYRTGLVDYTITNDGATYSAALAAYEVAQALVAEAQAQRAAEWTAYVNQVLSGATASLGTLAV